MAITLTRDLAFAAGQDAGNRAMRARLAQEGSQAPARWNGTEADIAIETTNRLLLYVPFEHGGLGGLDLSPLDRAGLLISDETYRRATCRDAAR